MVREKQPSFCSLETLCMKRKQKTYNTEQAIIRDIDDCNEKQLIHLTESEHLEDEGKVLIRSGNKEDVEQGKWLLKKSSTEQKRAKKLADKLLRLKEALAAFRTETLPIVIPDRLDRQVVL